jgi:transcriptional regulator with XRE-family HTH domain
MKKETFGKRLAKIRKQHGFSQVTLGRRLDVSKDTVCNWEKENTVPGIDHVLMLSELFGISMEYLWTGKERGGQPQGLGYRPPPELEVRVSRLEKALGAIGDVIRDLQRDLPPARREEPRGEDQEIHQQLEELKRIGKDYLEKPE